MKKLLRNIALTLSITLLGSSMNVAYASQEVPAIQQDIYEIETTETVDIDGIIYTYEYHYDNGNKAITITNDANDIVDEIIYNEFNSTYYLNGEASAFVSNESNESNVDTDPISKYGSRVYYEWVTKSSDSTYISWGKAVATSFLIGIIGAALGNMVSVAAIKLSIGATGLSILAGAAGGGTVYNTIQMFRAPFTNPQYRTLWSFKASTGDKYGEYIYLW